MSQGFGVVLLLTTLLGGVSSRPLSKRALDQINRGFTYSSGRISDLLALNFDAEHGIAL